MKKINDKTNIISRIIVLLLLVAGLIFLGLSIFQGKDTTYLTISLACICSGNFINVFVTNRQNRDK